MNESALTKKLAAYAKQEPYTWIRKTWGGIQGAGWPDLVGVSRGAFLGLEVKMPGKEKTLTALQAESLATIQRNGGVALVVTCKADIDYALTLALFASRVWDYTKDDKTGCHVWNGAPGMKGYGTIRGSRGGKKYACGAHRVAAAIFLGMDLRDKSVQANHACHNPLCVCTEPNHIYVGTQKENVRDMLEARRRPIRRGPNQTEASKREITRLYKDTTLSRRKIAEQFGTTPDTVTKIARSQLRDGKG